MDAKILSILFALSLLQFSSFAFDVMDDPCLVDCCMRYGGLPSTLGSGKGPACAANPSCMIMYVGESKGGYDGACIKQSTPPTGSSAFDKQSIAGCINTCEGTDFAPDPNSPFGGSQITEPEPQKAASVCDSVSCPSMCKEENSLPILYYDGRCVEDNSSASKYYCGYTRGQCIWSCNSAGTGCDDADPLSVSIDSLQDGADIDTGKGGFAQVTVSGTVSSTSEHQVARVVVTSTSPGTSIRASFDSSSNRFTASNIRVDEGKPAYLTATAYDSSGRRLGAKTIVVYPSPKMIVLSFDKKKAALLRNGAAIGEDWSTGATAYTAQEGDEFEISGGTGNVIATYSDGTMVIIKPPCRIKFFNKGIQLIKGAVEVEVSHDFQILGRLGYTLVKGTRFKVIVPDDGSTPESVIVLRGTVESGLLESPENTVAVGAGQHLYQFSKMIPISGTIGNANAGEMLSYEQGGAVTVPDIQGASPSGSGASCCASAIILSVLAAAALFFRPLVRSCAGKK